MSIQITILDETYLDPLDDLGRKFRHTLGFLTKETIREYLHKNRVLGALTPTGALIGYLMFANYPDRYRIAQLCVSKEMQGKGIAQQLFEHLKGLATTQKVIKLRCRNDFPKAHNFWPKLGFIALDEKPGRSKEGHLLTLWCYQLNSDDELGLWKAQTSDEILDVVIDAQIVYDFDEKDTEKSLMSKALLNDFLLDSLKLWVTDEIFNEIIRHTDASQREKSRNAAHGLARLEHNQALSLIYIEKLKTILPYRKNSEKSDIHHLAKTAASEIKLFVTRDEKILRENTAINKLTGVTVKHPASLISELHELAKKESYAPTRVSGLNLHWRRLKEINFSSITTQQFQKASETKKRLLELIRSNLADPSTFRVETLSHHEAASVIRILERPNQRDLIVNLARVASSSDEILYGRYLIADSLSIAVSENRQVVIFKGGNTSENIYPLLLNMGFHQLDNDYIRFTFSSIMTPDKIFETTSSFSPQLGNTFKRLNSIELEKQCSPLIIDGETPTPCFLVPVKPAYAMGLIDHAQSADDMFGGDPSVLLRWENVYYRKRSRHLMLQAPARILWYVSGRIGSIVAISHLDSIHIAPPKKLFRRFQKFGILEWREIYQLCERDIYKEIMALKFSHTFTLRNRIPLSKMRQIHQEDGIKESLQSPSLIPVTTFHKLYQLGFPSSS